MNQTKDTRFWLKSFFEGQEQLKHQYKSLQSQIQNNGCFIVNMNNETVKIYTPELAVIFTSKELPARNMDTQEETLINGMEYLKTYIEAYNEGEQYFETEYRVSVDTLYGVNAEQYVRDIHLNYFHVKHTGINNGWVYVKKQYPLILTHDAVKEFGYFSGIVSKVDEQVKKYSQLFATFDKCEHELTSEHRTQIANDKMEIVNELLGLSGGKENENSKSPVFHYIADVLNKHKLTPIEGAMLIDEMQGGYPPNFKKDILFPIIDYLDRQGKRLQSNANFEYKQTETKTEKLKVELAKYGFLDLARVKELSEANQNKLIELISTNSLPYSIAMFHYLGFLKYLLSEHFKTSYLLNKALAKWFEVTDRSVKGNISVLNEYSKEDRSRYTADQQQQIVKKDYEKLK